MPDLSTRQTLTDLTVRRIRPTDSRVEYPDSVVPGLRLIVQPSGAKSWALRTRVAGKIVKVTLLGADGVTDARERARKALEKAGAGERPVAALLKPLPPAPPPQSAVLFPVTTLAVAPPTVPALAAGPTVRDALDRYIAKQLTKPRTVSKTRSAMRETIALFGDWPVASVTEQEAKTLVNAADLRGPEARNTMIRTGSAFFNWCAVIDQDYIKSSPFARFKVSDYVARERALSDAEVKRLWRACEEQGPVFGQMFQFMLLTGARRSQVSEMQFSELDIPNRLWNVPLARCGKSGQAYEVYLTDAMLAVLNALPKFDGCKFVFSTDGVRSSSGFSKAKTSLDKRLTGMAAWTFHDLRRTFRTGIAKLGTVPSIAERCINHIDGYEAIYDRHQYQDEMNAAWSKWSNYVTKLTTETAQ